MNWPSMTMAFVRKRSEGGLRTRAAGQELRRHGREIVRLALALIAAFWTGTAAPGDAHAPPRFGPNEGEVLQVDRQAREITIRHGELPELGMSPMSMVFVVAHPGLLEHVRQGDHVKFKPGLVDGRFGVLSIEPIGRRGGKK